MKYKIFGCKVNKHYTDKRLNSDYLKNKNGIFVASCVVTDKAKRKRIKFVEKSLLELKNDEKIFISGCGAFEKGTAQDNFFELYPELEKNKSKIEILGEDPENNTSPLTPLLTGEGKIMNSNNKIYSPLRRGLGGGTKLDSSNKKISQINSKLKGLYTKKFVLIQGGCDSFCTFCLTVKKRGRHFYRDKDDIVEDILEFENSGGKEVVLTGVNLTAWGLDSTNDTKKSKFAELLEYILKNTKIRRIRISSLGPEFVNNDCLRIFKNERIYPHFHFSVQSGSSDVLKSMARHYDSKYIKELLIKTKNLKRDDGVDISLGADIIVGFPGETENDFEETYNLVKEVGIQKLHAFPFSKHEMGETVPAGIFKNQIPDKIKKDRLKRLNELGEQIRNDFINSQKGKKLKVLIESVKNIHHPDSLLTGEGKKVWKGWTQNYIEATNTNFKIIISGEIKRNEIVEGELF